MAKIRILITAVLGAIGCFLYITSDKYKQGFDYCDKCYRSALNSMRENIRDGMCHASIHSRSETDYDRGLEEGYRRCLLNLDVLLEYIGEHHES